MSLGTCGKLETLSHRLVECQRVEESFKELKKFLVRLIGGDITDEKIMTLSFKDRNRNKLQICLWVTVKYLFKIHHEDQLDATTIFKNIYSEMVWYYQMNIVIGSKVEMKRILEILKN